MEGGWEGGRKEINNDWDGLNNKYIYYLRY